MAKITAPIKQSSMKIVKKANAGSSVAKKLNIAPAITHRMSPTSG